MKRLLVLRAGGGGGLISPLTSLFFLSLMINLKYLKNLTRSHQTQAKLLWHCSHWKSMMSSPVSGSLIYHSPSKMSHSLFFDRFG